MATAWTAAVRRAVRGLAHGETLASGWGKRGVQGLPCLGWFQTQTQTQIPFHGQARDASSSSSGSGEQGKGEASCLDLKQYEHVCGTEAKLFVGEKHGVARIELDRMQARNALGKAMLEDLEECVAKTRDLSRDHTVRCLVVHSCSESVFCAGADLKERRAMSDDQVVEFVKRLRTSFLDLQRVPVPTIAAVGGVALGGGFEIALACDLRVGSDTCLVGLPETRLAIIPGAGGTQRLARLLGVTKAKDLVFTGRHLKAYEAFEMGVLDRYTIQKPVLDEALALAEEIVRGGPIALQQAKQAIDEGLEQLTWEEAMGVEEKCYAKVVPTTDRLEALDAFAQKRKPQFKGE